MVQNAISEPPETEEEKTYNGALFPGVEIPRDNTEAVLKKFSRIFPWGNGAPITEKVLFDLLKGSAERTFVCAFVPVLSRLRRGV